MEKETKKSTFQERLKELRGNLSLSAVAKELQISRASLGYYENGDRNPDAEILLRMANYFDVSCDYLLGISDVRSRDCDVQFINKTLGLNERAIATLKGYQMNATRTPKDWLDTTPMYCKLLVETINALLGPNTELLDNIMLYLFVHFTHYYDDYSYDDEKKYTHISELGLFDKRLGIGYSDDYDYLSPVFLTKITKELMDLREHYHDYPFERITPIANPSDEVNPFGLFDEKAPGTN